jgi:hypothetical protein
MYVIGWHAFCIRKRLVAYDFDDIWGQLSHAIFFAIHLFQRPTFHVQELNHTVS